MAENGSVDAAGNHLAAALPEKEVEAPRREAEAAFAPLAAAAAEASRMEAEEADEDEEDEDEDEADDAGGRVRRGRSDCLLRRQILFPSRATRWRQGLRAPALATPKTNRRRTAVRPRRPPHPPAPAA